MNAALRASRQIERTYHTKQSQKLYLVLEDVNWYWDEREVKQFDALWKQGKDIWEIASAFDRDPDEVALLVMDRRKKGAIRCRPNGVYGWNKK